MNLHFGKILMFLLLAGVTLFLVWLSIVWYLLSGKDDYPSIVYPHIELAFNRGMFVSEENLKVDSIIILQYYGVPGGMRGPCDPQKAQNYKALKYSNCIIVGGEYGYKGVYETLEDKYEEKFLLLSIDKAFYDIPKIRAKVQKIAENPCRYVIVDEELSREYRLKTQSVSSEPRLYNKSYSKLRTAQKWLGCETVFDFKIFLMVIDNSTNDFELINLTRQKK